MRCRAFIGLLFVLGLSALPCGGTGDPAVIAVLELKDGRVLHHASIMADEWSNLVVRADEGLVKVPREDLPPGSMPDKPVSSPDSGPGLVMQPFNPDSAPAEPLPPAEAKKPTPKPVAPAPPKAKPAPNPVYKGCTITSFQTKPYQGVLGCLEVVVSNPTDQIVILRPGDFICITASGVRHVGRNIITDGYPPHLKRREVVPPQGEIDDIVTFTDSALENPTVQWAH